MIKKAINWLASFLELQLIISLLSLPVLIDWGLAISYMLPLANLIFTPLLALFLWCSCLFTLCVVIHAPSNWLATILDHIAQIWFYFLSFSQPNWLVGFNQKMFWISSSIAIFLIITYTFFYPNKKRSLIILISCCVFLFATRWLSQKNCLYKIENLPMYALRLNDKILIIDNGALSSKQNFYSWIDYTILPKLVKTDGITIVDTLILYKPNKKLVKAALQFAQQTMIKTILVTTKHGCYQAMKEAFKDSAINVIPIYYNTSKKSFLLNTNTKKTPLPLQYLLLNLQQHISTN